MSNTINWFEIPSRDMDRAVRFYEATLAKTLKREVFGGVPHAVFPSAEGSVTGAIVAATDRQPGAAGPLIYLDCTDGVPATVDRAKQAGAAVVLPVTSIGEFGWIAVIRDLDGNEVGLHAGAKAA